MNHGFQLALETLMPASFGIEAAPHLPKPTAGSMKRRETAALMGDAMVAGRLLDADIGFAEIRMAGLMGPRSEGSRYDPPAAFAYPSIGQAGFLRRHARRLVECGAGSGLYAHALARNGFDIVATDPSPIATMSLAGPLLRAVNLGDVLVKDGVSAVSSHADRDVLVVMWAPDETWVLEVLAAVTEAGRRVFLMPDEASFLDPAARACRPCLRRRDEAAISAIEAALRTSFRLLEIYRSANLFAFERTRRSQSIASRIPARFPRR